MNKIVVVKWEQTLWFIVEGGGGGVKPLIKLLLAQKAIKKYLGGLN